MERITECSQPVETGNEAAACRLDGMSQPMVQATEIAVGYAYDRSDLS
jgi:hypothetical protein